MAALRHTVKVTVGEERLEIAVWDAYDIILDLWTPGSPFAFTVPRARNDSSAWSRLKRAIKFGAFVKVSIDESVQMTGKIEHVKTWTARGGSTITFAGRDLAGPAIDWDADPKVRLRGLTLEDALTALFAPLGLAVRIGTDVDATREVQTGTVRSARPTAHRPRRRRTQPIDRGRPQPGERIWQLAERIVGRFGYMIWLAPDADGAMSVIVDVPRYDSGTLFEFKREIRNGRTTLDSNILEGGQDISTRDVPTDINVYTNAAMGDAQGARIAAQLSNLWIFNPDVMGGYETVSSINQPRHIRAQEARTQSAALREAQRTASRANAKSRRVTVKVQGHGQRVTAGPGGILHYAPNCMAHIRDEWETDPNGNPLDEDMLIERVHFKGGRKIGTTTEITMHPRGAIVLDPDESEAA